MPRSLNLRAGKHKSSRAGLYPRSKIKNSKKVANFKFVMDAKGGKYSETSQIFCLLPFWDHNRLPIRNKEDAEKHQYVYQFPKSGKLKNWLRSKRTKKSDLKLFLRTLCHKIHCRLLLQNPDSKFNVFISKLEKLKLLKSFDQYVTEVVYMLQRKAVILAPSK